ncbi:C-type lectin domain family 10 member A-like isoform X1 [Leucoraja erinacea]|uniref:C-type lectin domain family 10 member A-like isoform X1 n=1 Tax=Leucoraja erinaceus TaxID=7782 RepID=UPI0024586820|nr:C-type lectin domain family 10 member A-like isoform X1 [Leucoraja erinacea]
MALENPSNDALQNLSICDSENSVLFKTGSEWTRLSKPRKGEIIGRVTVTLCLIGLGVLTVLSIIAYMKISVDVKELQDSFKSVNGQSTRQGNDLQLGDHINQMQTLMDALNMSTLSELQNLKEEGFHISENLNVMIVSLNNVNSSLLSKFQRMEKKAVTVLDNIQTMQDSLSQVGLNVQTLKEADKQFSQVQEQNSNSIQLFKDSVSLQLQQVMSLVANLSGEMEKLEELNSTLMSMLELKDRNHCPEHFMLYGDKCYLFSLIADTFPNAKRECQLTQSYLMVIHNEAEQKFIADRLGSNLYWIGLTDSVKEGDWHWEDGTSYSSTPKFWKPGQPDNFQDGEHCAHLVAGGLWNDNACTMQYKYICQKLPG